MTMPCILIAMVDVRPTVRVLKELQKGKKLPAQALRLYKAAQSHPDELAKIDMLVEVLDIVGQEVALVKDARNRFASGLPDQHRAITKKAGEPVYEVRDTESPAWRGAIVTRLPRQAWVVHADRHDEFHKTGPTVIWQMRQEQRLGPSPLDQRLQNLTKERLEDKTDRTALLTALLNALHQALTTQASVRLEVPSISRLQTAKITLAVDGIGEIQLDPGNVRDELDVLRLKISLSMVSVRTRAWLINTCIPFLQPETSMVEVLFRKDLTIQILLGRARLMQLMSSSKSDLSTKRRDAPAASVLHYTGSKSLARAYVEGIAVQAVCGEWWLPDVVQATDTNLPVCPECERLQPIASFLP